MPRGIRMSGSRPGGIPGWGTWQPDDQPRPRRRKTPYLSSVGWAVMAWIVTVAVVYLIWQGGLPQLGGGIGLAGFMLGTWFGGTRGGIRGRREWVVFVILVLGIAFVLAGFASCAYAIALYG